MNKKVKLLLSILFLIVFVYTVYNIYETYALLETDEIVTNDFNTANWNILINDTLLGEGSSTFLVDKIKIDDNSFVKENKLAPGTSGYFDISIDPSSTDVSIKYDVSFDFSKVLQGIDIVSIKETSGSSLIKTGENTYTNVITLKEIKENKKNNIRVNVVWNNIEENSVEDSKIGLIYNNKLDIPVTVTVTQYLGEEIKEYE